MVHCSMMGGIGKCVAGNRACVQHRVSPARRGEDRGERREQGKRSSRPPNIA